MLCSSLDAHVALAARRQTILSFAHRITEPPRHLLTVAAAVYITHQYLVHSLTATHAHALLLCSIPFFRAQPPICVSLWQQIGCFVALNVRLAALIVLLPSFYSRFTIEHGLTFQATADSRWCDAHAPDRVHAAGFHAAACWLVTLLIWEVTFLPNLQWDDWVHHVLTAVVLSW